MKIKFKVTANDIKYGIWGDGRHCPIHRSLARRKPFKGKDFIVNWIGVRLASNDEYICKFDKKSRAFVLAFDKRLHVEPFEGEIQWVG